MREHPPVPQPISREGLDRPARRGEFAVITLNNDALGVCDIRTQVQRNLDRLA